jgi:hypothetical protein
MYNIGKVVSPCVSDLTIGYDSASERLSTNCDDFNEVILLINSGIPECGNSNASSEKSIED